MIRKLIAKLNSLMAERVVSVRHQQAVPIKLSFEPSGATGKLDAGVRGHFITGETRDLSSTGIAFIVLAIRIKENYLVGEGRVLNAELDLPNGKILMKVVGQRYEQIGEHITTACYLVGASINSMTTENREAYNEFLRLGGRQETVRGLKFGIDEN